MPLVDMQLEGADEPRRYAREAKGMQDLPMMLKDLVAGKPFT